MKNLGDQLQVKNIHPIASVAATALGSAIDLNDLSGEIAVIVDVANSAGTLPTLALKLQESDTEGGSYTDVVGGGFTSLTTVAAVEKISLNKDSMKRWVKISKTIGGTDSPAYLLSVKAVGINKYPA